MIDTGGLRRGMILDMDGDLVRIVEFQHVKQGRGSAFVRLTMKNLRTGSTTVQTFQAGSKFTSARLERQRAQYLYADDGHHYFMDVDTFDQFPLSSEILGEALRYIKDESVIEVLTYNDNPVDIEIPITVELKVTETDPGFRGDTATGGSKPATVETGLNVTVPLFVNIGDVLKIDTRSGEYIERVL